MTKRLLAALAVMVGFVALAVPAGGHQLFPDYRVHHRCPDGITLVLGGGSGFRDMLREATRVWNEHANTDPAFPKITKWVDGDWNGLVWGYNAGDSPNPCMIDTDEQYDMYQDGVAIAGLGGMSSFTNYGEGSNRNHPRSGFVLFDTKDWSGGDCWDHKITQHELGHAMGFGHTFESGQEASFMSYSEPCKRWWTDDNWKTMGFLYKHTH